MNPYLLEICYPQNPKIIMRIHYSQSSREDATPSSGTSPVASYKEATSPSSGDARGKSIVSERCLIKMVYLNLLPPTKTRST